MVNESVHNYVTQVHIYKAEHLTNKVQLWTVSHTSIQIALCFNRIQYHRKDKRYRTTFFRRFLKIQHADSHVCNASVQASHKKIELPHTLPLTMTTVLTVCENWCITVFNTGSHCEAFFFMTTMTTSSAIMVRIPVTTIPVPSRKRVEVYYASQETCIRLHLTSWVLSSWLTNRVNRTSLVCHTFNTITATEHTLAITHGWKPRQTIAVHTVSNYWACCISLK